MYEGRKLGMDTWVTRKRRRCRLRKMSTQELLARYKALFPYDVHRIYAISLLQHYCGVGGLRHVLVSELAKYPVKKGEG